MSGEQAAPLGVVAALSAVMADVGGVGKDGVNHAQKFHFRGIDAVVNAVSPALRKHGVVVMPHVVAESHETASTKSGAVMNTVHVTVDYRFHGPDGGEPLVCRVVAESFDSGDKATAKAMSVAFRTALLQALCLPTSDPDPDESSYERGPAQRQDRPSRAEEAPVAPTRAAVAWRALGPAGQAHVRAGWPFQDMGPGALPDARWEGVADLFAQGADVDGQQG